MTKSKPNWRKLLDKDIMNIIVCVSMGAFVGYQIATDLFYGAFFSAAIAAIILIGYVMAEKELSEYYD